MKKINVEVEGSELLIQSKEGHYAVIPAKHRQEVMDMVTEGCDDCINSYIQTLPRDSDYAPDGSLLPDWDKIKAVLNPKNWGVPDYSDKYKTQGEAYKNAQDKSEFLYNGVRIKKDIASDNRNSAYLQNKNYWREYKNYLSENFSDDDIEKRYNDALDLHYKYGNPKIKLTNDGDDKIGVTETSNRSSFNPSTNEMIIYFSVNGKLDREFMFNNYKQELLHARQLKDLGKQEFYRQSDPNSSTTIMHLQNELVKKGYKLPLSTKKNGMMDGVYGDETSTIVKSILSSDEYKKYVGESYKYKEKDWNKNKRAEILDALSFLGVNTFATSPYAYVNSKDIEYVHNRETDGINSRYNRDYELEENPKYKQERLKILNTYIANEFNPYKNQGDLRVIQKSLTEQGYKLPKSTREDGDFDGILGDETKNALLDYQIKNKKNEYKPLEQKDITSEYKPYTAVQDNTYVVPKVIIPLEQKKKQQ